MSATVSPTVWTYRWLRLGIGLLLAFLSASVLVEVAFGDSPVLGSISAYWYTPVRGVFVGTLTAMGLSMIAIQGRERIGEDLLLNVAGMLSPVVAVVPTPADLPTCTASVQPACRPANLDDDVTNNLAALLIVGAMALAIVWAVAAPYLRARRLRTVGYLIGVAGVLGLAAATTWAGDAVR